MAAEVLALCQRCTVAHPVEDLQGMVVHPHRRPELVQVLGPYCEACLAKKQPAVAEQGFVVKHLFALPAAGKRGAYSVQSLTAEDQEQEPAHEPAPPCARCGHRLSPQEVQAARCGQCKAGQPGQVIKLGPGRP